MNNERITILGGGIAGLSASIALERIGLKATIIEAAPELAYVGAGLGLSTNAINALGALGLKEQVLRTGRSLQAFSVLDRKGRVITRTATPDRADNVTIHRGDLQRLLRAQVEDARIETGRQAVGLRTDAAGVTLAFADGTLHRTEYLIVADGIRSAIRRTLLPGSVERYAGYTCWRAVIDGSGLDIQEASETWGPNGRFGIVPLAGGQLYWFACVNAPRNDPAMAHAGMEDLLRMFGDYHAPIPEILKRTRPAEVLHNDIMDLAPLKRFAFSRILLIGDAAHATTPNMGQGAAQAIEDAVVLAQAARSAPNLFTAFRWFERTRLERTRWITETSRRIGRVAQITAPVAAHLRNALLRLLPRSVNERPMRRIADVYFAPLHLAPIGGAQSASAVGCLG